MSENIRIFWLTLYSLTYLLRLLWRRQDDFVL